MNLKQWRALDGRHQTDVAEALGCAQSTVQRIESGAQSPTADQIRKLVALSGGKITADAMLGLTVGDAI